MIPFARGRAGTIASALRRSSVTVVLCTALAGAVLAADSRGDVAGLPEGVQPWWSSRYGPDDQLGTLNEVTPPVTAAAAVIAPAAVY